MGIFFSIKQNNYPKDTIFWKHYGILIPYNIESIPSMDGVNIIGSRGGTETLMDIIDDCSYTFKEYQKKFAKKGTDGKLYWKQ